MKTRILVTFVFVCSLPETAADPSFTAKEWTRDIYPDGFTGENICRLARLQSWSFRPAVIRN